MNLSLLSTFNFLIRYVSIGHKKKSKFHGTFLDDRCVLVVNEIVYASRNRLLIGSFLGSFMIFIFLFI